MSSLVTSRKASTVWREQLYMSQRLKPLTLFSIAELLHKLHHLFQSIRLQHRYLTELSTSCRTIWIHVTHKVHIECVKSSLIDRVHTQCLWSVLNECKMEEWLFLPCVCFTCFNHIHIQDDMTVLSLCYRAGLILRCPGSYLARNNTSYHIIQLGRGRLRKYDFTSTLLLPQF